MRDNSFCWTKSDLWKEEVMKAIGIVFGAIIWVVILLVVMVSKALMGARDALIYYLYDYQGDQSIFTQDTGGLERPKLAPPKKN